MRERAIWMAVAFLLLASLLVPGARPQQLTMGGYVRPAFHVDLAAANAAAPCIRWERVSPSALRLWLSTSDACPASIQIDVALRTNASEYVFVVTQASENAVRVQFELPRPTGADVHPQAAASFRAAHPVCAAQHCVGTGTRISIRGPFSSSQNALLVPLTLVMDTRLAQTSVDLSLGEK